LKSVIAGCLALSFPYLALPQATGAPSATANKTGAISRLTQDVFDYLTMAGQTTVEFRPLSQHERNTIYLKSLINPIWYFKGALSGAIDLSKDKPKEWEQGASGYSKRVANIMGQYAIQRTATFGLASLLHEDNRYFGSGKKGFWRRAAYALSSSVMARHDSGRQYPSISLIAGFAAGAFVSRVWQPPSTRSAGDGAVSFGLSMGYNAFTGMVKEFLPDMVQPLTAKRPSPPPTP